MQLFVQQGMWKRFRFHMPCYSSINVEKRRVAKRSLRKIVMRKAVGFGRTKVTNHPPEPAAYMQHCLWWKQFINTNIKMVPKKLLNCLAPFGQSVILFRQTEGYCKTQGILQYPPLYALRKELRPPTLHPAPAHWDLLRHGAPASCTGRQERTQSGSK